MKSIMICWKIPHLMAKQVLFCLVKLVSCCICLSFFSHIRYPLHTPIGYIYILYDICTLYYILCIYIYIYDSTILLCIYIYMTVPYYVYIYIWIKMTLFSVTGMMAIGLGESSHEIRPYSNTGWGNPILNHHDTGTQLQLYMYVYMYKCINE